MTDLDIAINSGNFITVIEALRGGAQVDANTLDKAIATNNDPIVRSVIEAGAQIDANTLDNVIATKSGPIVRSVIEAGARASENTLDKAIASKNPFIINTVKDAAKKQSESEIEVRKNSRVIFGSYANRSEDINEHGFFSWLPREVNIFIASKTLNPAVHDDKESYEIAYNSFARPVVK